MAKQIISRINAVPHTTYAEPFVGMGGIFLRRNSVPKSEVINDFNSEIAVLFRILQRHYSAFMEMMKYQITSRKEFERLASSDPSTLTDLERAARFLYQQRLAFGGKPTGNFGVSVARPGRFDINKLGPLLDDVHSRLSGVVIECLSYDEFIPRYDRTGTLFYLDPPYFGNENDYGKGMFVRKDFQNLAHILHGISGKFIMSLNDRPEVWELFASFNIESVSTTYSIAKNNSMRAGEVLISNI